MTIAKSKPAAPVPMNDSEAHFWSLCGTILKTRVPGTKKKCATCGKKYNPDARGAGFRRCGACISARKDPRSQRELYRP